MSRADGLRDMLGPEKKKKSISPWTHTSPSNSQSPLLAPSNQNRIAHTRQSPSMPKPLPLLPGKPSKIPTSSFSVTPRTTGFTLLSPTPEGESVAISTLLKPQRDRDPPISSTISLGPAGFFNKNAKKWETDENSTRHIDAEQEVKPGPPAGTTGKISRKPPPPPLETSNLKTDFMAAPLIPVLTFRGSNLFDDEGSRTWLASPNNGSPKSNFVSTPMSAILADSKLDHGSNNKVQKFNLVNLQIKDSEQTPQSGNSKRYYVTSRTANNAEDQAVGQHSPTFDYDAFPKTPTKLGFHTALAPVPAKTGHQEQQNNHSWNENSVDTNRVSMSFSYQRGNVEGDASPVSALFRQVESGERPRTAPPDLSSTVDAVSRTSSHGQTDSAGGRRIINNPSSKDSSLERYSKEIRDGSISKLHTNPSEGASLSMLSPTRSHFSSDSSRPSSRDDSSRPSSGQSQASYVSMIDIDYHSFLVNSYNTSQPPPPEEHGKVLIDLPQAVEPQPSKLSVSKSAFWHFKSISKTALVTRARDSFFQAPVATKIISFNDRQAAKGARLKQKISSYQLGSNAKAEQILGTSIAGIVSPEPRALPINSSMQSSQNPNSASNSSGERAALSIDSSTKYKSTSTAVTDDWSKGYQNSRSTGNTTPTEYPPTKSQVRENPDEKPTLTKSLPAPPNKVLDLDIPSEALPNVSNAEQPVITATVPTPVLHSHASPPKDAHRNPRPFSPQPVTKSANVEDGDQTRPNLPEPAATSLETSSQISEVATQIPSDNRGNAMDLKAATGFGAKSRVNPRKPAPLQLDSQQRPFLLPTISASRVSVRSAPIAEDKGQKTDRFLHLRHKANEFSIDKVDPITKILVVCCSCRHFQDLLERDYALMMRAERTSYGKGVGDPRVECRCGHAMTTICCEGYSAVVYLRKRLH